MTIDIDATYRDDAIHPEVPLNRSWSITTVLSSRE
jgi:hypothetical protein